MLFFVALTLLSVLFGCGDAQCDFPDENNLANAVSDAIGATIVSNSTNVLCLAESNIENEYSNAVVAAQVIGFDFPFINLEVRCVDGVNGSVWNNVNLQITNATSLALPLMEPCSQCSIISVVLDEYSEAVCSLAEFFFINETMIEVDESTFQLTLCTELGGAVLSQDIYIQLMDTPSTTAQPGTDYILPTPFEVFYPAGSGIGTQKCVNISIVDDDTLEGTHNFTVNLVDLGNPCCNVVSPSTIQIDILDNEGANIGFDSISLLTPDESQSSIDVCLIISNLPISGSEVDISVTLAGIDGTALEGEDYTIESAVVFFIPIISGNTACATVNITGDEIFEGDEMFSIRMDSASIDEITFTEDVLNITIIDDDNAVFYPQVMSPILENVNSSICIQLIEPNGGLGIGINLTIGSSDGSAIAPDDYVQIFEIVEFSSGLEVNATICREININDDQELEGNETFTIHIFGANVPNIMLPHPYVEVIILDNDIADIFIRVDDQQFGFISPDFLEAMNIYIFDDSQGSPSDLTIDCEFSGPASELLVNSSSWRVDFFNSTINGLIQTEPYEVSLVNSEYKLPTANGDVNVSFIAGGVPTQVLFDPKFEPELAGTFQCHENISTFPFGPVMVTVSTFNPVFIYEGQTSFNLVFPITELLIYPLYAEYRYNNQQKIADSELSVYYMDGITKVSGTIMLLDINMRSYGILFSNPLPPVTELVIELDLSSQLGSINNFTLNVLSHGLQVNPSTRVEVAAQTNVTLECISLVPSISIEWSYRQFFSFDSSLLLNSVSVEDSGFYDCEIESDQEYPENATSFIRVSLIVYPNPVSIRSDGDLRFISQPAIINPLIEPPQTLTIICNGLPGNGNLMWTTFPEIPLFGDGYGVVNQTAVNELSLTLTAVEFISTSADFICTSMESGQTASVFVTSDTPYLRILSYPSGLLSIGQTENITYFAAIESDGYSHFSEGLNFNIEIPDVEVVPDNVVQKSPDNIFVFIYVFNVSVVFNNTVTTTFEFAASVSVNLTVIAPELGLISMPPFRFISRQAVLLKCSSSDPNAVVSWLKGNSMLSSPKYVTTQGSISTIQFIPYIFDLRYFLTAPLFTGLTDITYPDQNWVEIEEGNITCTICDNFDFDFVPCEPMEQIQPQIIPVEILFHPVTLFNGDIQMYNNSIVNRMFEDMTISCKSTKGNGKLIFMSDIEGVNEYFASEDFEEPFVFSDFTNISVTVSSDYDISADFIGGFDSSLSGEYGCYSEESGVMSKVLLTTDFMYLELLVSPVVLHTLGTSVFIPYRAAYIADGSPMESQNTLFSIQYTYPGQMFLVPEERKRNLNFDLVHNYEVSPYNYGLYIETLLSTLNGSYSITLDGDGDIRRVNITVNIAFPTISVPEDSVSVIEGGSITITCTPSDDQVQLFWSLDPPGSFPQDIESQLFGELEQSVVSFDSELKHSLTLSDVFFAPFNFYDNEGTYYCYVRGDEFETIVQPGEIFVNVLTFCNPALTGGIIFGEIPRLEGEIVPRQCSDVSSKFTSSSILTISRECGSFGWNRVQFSGCTVVEGVTDPFAILDFVLDAKNISVVQQQEEQILLELRNSLGVNASNITSLSITKYLVYDYSGTNGIAVTAEAVFNPDSIDDVDAFSFYNADSFGGFYHIQVNGFVQSLSQFNGFEPSGICDCVVVNQTDRRVIIFPGNEFKRNGFPEEEERPPVFSSTLIFQRICIGVSAPPCLCSDKCECSNPFVGNGDVCTVDSDSDGYPDMAINDAIQCNETNTSISSLPNYCFSDTCPDIYNPEQTPPICDNIVIDGCEAETGSEYGIEWPSTSPNTNAQQDCGGPDVIGFATRYCNGNGEWLAVNASSCISRVFKEITDRAALLFVEELSTLNSTQLEMMSLEAVILVDELAIATQDTDGTEQSLFPSELEATNDVLFETIQLLNASYNANGRSTVNTTGIADTLSNVLDTRNQPGWNSVQDNNPTMGPELLLDNAEDFGLFLATSLDNDTSVTIARDNIVITAMLILVEDNTIYEDVTFPTQDVVSSEMFSDDSIFIPNELVEARASGRVILPISNILFNTIQEFLESSNSTGTIIPGTRVISSQVGVQRGNIDYTALLQDSPVNITLGVQVENFSDPSCVFWQFSSPIGTGFWSSEGITTVYVDGGETVICLSNHLTSFAVLVDTAGTTPTLSEAERTALSIVSYILLTISVVCLILTVIFFLSFGKQLFTSVHNFVHLNLALALLIAFCVFLFGIESAVDNRVACTFIAALLHYFFLSVFCWMLCEGVMLYLMLVVVFSTLSKKWWFFLILGWIPPIIPVVVTVGVTHDFYTDAEFFCWLSVDRNVIWAFTVPMIIIIIINTVFLVFVMITLVKNRGSQNARKLEENKRVDVVITTIKASIILLPLLGLTWLFGLLAVNQQTSFLAWLFVILNASQGTAIFILHVVRNERIWNRLVKRYQKLSPKSGEYSTTSQSSGTTQKKRKYLHYKEKDITLSTSGGTFHEKEKFELAPVATIDENPVGVVDEESNDFEEDLDIEKQPLGGNEYVQVGQQSPLIPTSFETSDQVPPKQDKKLSITPAGQDQNEKDDTQTPAPVEEGLDYSLRYSIKRPNIKTEDDSNIHENI